MCGARNENLYIELIIERIETKRECKLPLTRRRWYKALKFFTLPLSNSRPHTKNVISK